MKSFDILLCDCKKYFDDKKWRSFNSVDNVLDKMIKLNLTKSKLDENYEFIQVPKLDLKKNPFKIKSNNKIINAFVKFTKCDMCQKKSANYYEGYVQIRCKNEEILEEANKYIKKQFKENRDKVIALDIVKKKHSLDMKVSSNKFIQNLSTKLVKAFGGKLNLSRKLFSKNKQTGKSIYRLTATVYLPFFTKNQVVLYDNKLILVKHLAKVSGGVNLQNGKQVNFKNIDLAEKIIDIHKASISKTHPELEVIHPETFQSEKLVNSKLIKPKNKSTTEVVIWNGLYGVEI